MTWNVTMKILTREWMDLMTGLGNTCSCRYVASTSSYEVEAMTTVNGLEREHDIDCGNEDTHCE